MSSVIRGSDNFDTSDNATQTELDAIESYSDSDVLTLFNASGSAPVYACRAWVNFKGTGTVSIRGSGGVSSITDRGTGLYTMNFSFAMQDINYSGSGSAIDSITSTNRNRMLNVTNWSTTYTYVHVFSTSGSASDAEIASVQVYR